MVRIPFIGRRAEASQYKIGNVGEHNAETVVFAHIPVFNLAQVVAVVYVHPDTGEGRSVTLSEDEWHIQRLDPPLNGICAWGDYTWTVTRTETQTAARLNAYIDVTFNDDLVWRSDPLGLLVEAVPEILSPLTESGHTVRSVLP